MEKWLKPHNIEIVILAIFGFIFWRIGSEYDAFETLLEFLRSHEDMELDEILLGLMMLGFLGFFYAFRRFHEARQALHERERAQRDIKWLAHHDPLTRLPNRRYLEDFCNRLNDAKDMTPFTVFSIDLDGFKRVNDLLGHAAGDGLLEEISLRLKRIAPDDLLARIGGDEFVMLCRTTEMGEAQALGRRLRNAIKAPIKLGSVHADVDASIGYACFPDHGASLTQVIHASDAAMYAAKRAGRGGVLAFEESMRDLIVQRARMERDLKAALRNHEIVPFYQPLVDLRSGELTGFEALARWVRADGTSIPPTEFIALAEDCGLIGEIGEYLLQRACREAKAWPAHLKLAFNLSPLQLGDRHLGLRIVKILGEIGYLPQRLEIEVTESALIKETEVAITVLTDLHNAGIRIALDDFGTGYSSLSQLSKFHFDRIKIDRSFVSSFETDARQRNIVRAILMLGQGLGISVTAEGIEDESQKRELTRLGCTDGQGYLFGKARSSVETLALIAAMSPAGTQKQG